MKTIRNIIVAIQYLSFHEIYKRLKHRTVRTPLRFILTNNMKLNPKCINDAVRQAGYTSGDRIVVVLEDDFNRIAKVANSKAKTPMDMIYNSLWCVAFDQELTPKKDWICQKK